MDKATEEYRRKDVLRHMLGMSRGKKPYRNYFCAHIGSPDDELLLAMVQDGLIEKGRRYTDSEYQFYHATAAGRALVGAAEDRE